MNYLMIESEGEIENGAFTLIGASTKRSEEGKIGYYGSGLKYSISALIRNGVSFKIFSGEREVKITTEKYGFRNDEFEIIKVDGKETSLTTNMGGSDWDNPFSPIREIYSNALDEDEDAKLSKRSFLDGKSGMTRFYIEQTKEVKHFYDNVKLYFCNHNEMVLNANISGAIYPAVNNELRLFRRNILCYHSVEEKSLFNYNSPNLTINESRVLSSEWRAKTEVAAIWKEVKNHTLIRQFLKGLEGGNTGKWEHDLNWSSSYKGFSDEWHEVAKGIRFVPAEIVMYANEIDLEGRMILPSNLLKDMNRNIDGLDILGLTEGSTDLKYIVDNNPSQILVNKVLDAISLLSETRYRFRMEKGLDITYVKFLNESVMGFADKDKIFLSTKLDTHDVSHIAKIIIEENEHNLTGYGDETREFQNHLFNLYYEELNR